MEKWKHWNSTLIHLVFAALVYIYVFLGSPASCKKWHKVGTSKKDLSTIGVPDCPVKLALVLCDEKPTDIGNNFDRQINQTLVLIKSLLISMEEDSCVHILVITNKKTHFRKIKSEVFGRPERWDVKFTRHLNLEYVELKYPKEKEWMRGLYQNRPCSSFRLFLPDVLPYDAVILSDTDMIYFRDIKYLWAEFSKFSDSALISMSTHRTLAHPKPPYQTPLPRYRNVGVTSTIMVMNLTRMRNTQWTNKVLLASSPYLGSIQQYKYGKAEEDMLNIYFNRFPKEVSEHSCDWNFTPCKCSRAFACLRQPISALHGVILSFFKTNQTALFRSVFQTYTDTQLTSDFDLHDLIRRLKLGIRDKNLKKCECSPVGRFEKLVVGRLEEKLRRNKAQLSLSNERLS